MAVIDERAFKKTMHNFRGVVGIYYSRNTQYMGHHQISWGFRENLFNIKFW